MDIQTITGLFNTIGTAGIFLYACWYLMRRMEAKESERAKESQEREKQLQATLAEAEQTRTSTEMYIRTTLSACAADSTKAMQNVAETQRGVAQALEHLPCQKWRDEDIYDAISERRVKKERT